MHFRIPELPLGFQREGSPSRDDQETHQDEAEEDGLAREKEQPLERREEEVGDEG